MAGDLHFKKVAVLCNFDSSTTGAGGEKFFVDESLSPKVIASGGSAIDVTATQSRFGTKSLYVPSVVVWPSVGGVGDFAFGLDDFCIEISVRPDLVKAQAFLSFRTSSEGYWMLYFNASGLLRLYNGADGVMITASAPSPSVTWGDISLSREDGTFRLFENGTLIGSAYSSRSITPTHPLRLGYDSQGSNFFEGYLDALRITMGEARWTSSYTPSSTAFKAYSGEISGVIRDQSGTPTSRVVRAYDRSSGRFVGEATSDPISGAYLLECKTGDECSVVCLDDAAGVTQNDLITRATPV